MASPGGERTSFTTRPHTGVYLNTNLVNNSDSPDDNIPVDYTPILLSPRRYATETRPSTSPVRRELTSTISPELYNNRAECLLNDTSDEDLPPKYSYLDHYLQPQNQQIVGVAAVCAELVECRTTALKTYCSAQYIVDKLTRPTATDAIDDDAATTSSVPDITMYQGMHVLKHYGCPQQETYDANHAFPPATNQSPLVPTMPSNSHKQLTDSAFLISDATEFAIENFASVSTIVCAKYCLVNYGPLAIIVPCYSTTNKYLWRPTHKATVDPRDLVFTSSVVGYHAMTVIAYNEHGFLLRNSWGIEWGDGGYTTFPYSDWGLQAEIWTKISTLSRRRLSRPEPVGLLRRIVSAVNSASNSPRSSASSPRTQSSKNSPRSMSGSPRDN